MIIFVHINSSIYTEGKDKVAFQCKGVVVLTVIEVYIHRVYILGLAVHAFPSRGESHHLSVKSLHKGEVFRFRVADDNVIVGNEERICHFPFCRKGFLASRRSQDKPFRVFKLLPVAEYHIIGKCVQPVVKGSPGLEKLLRDKGDKDCGAARRQSPVDRDKVLAQWNAAHQACFLLIVKPGKGAVIFLCDTCHVVGNIKVKII